MCTAVVWPLPDGYLFAFNRDEVVWRTNAIPPAPRGLFLAPIDPEGGGTWLATNAFGLTLAALNVYEEAAREPQEPIRSRGLLVTDLADAADLRMLATRVQNHPHLRHTRPFHLLAVASDHAVLEAHWDGLALTLSHAVLPILRVSAAVDAPAVHAARILEFSNLQADLCVCIHKSTALRTWFSSHEQHGSPRGVCMHREPIAATVSHTQVHVKQMQTEMWYVAGAPCQDPPEFRVTLSRS